MDKSIKFKKEIKRAIADYIASEGCSCCQDIEAHKEAEERLGKILKIPMYKDKSGYDFNRYKTKPKYGKTFNTR